jgi:hypothetical protein
MPGRIGGQRAARRLQRHVLGVVVGSIPAARRRSSISGACPLSAARSILRRWLKAAATTRLSTLRIGGIARLGQRLRCTTAERTLGGGVKASGGSVIAIRAVVRHWARIARRP